DAADATSRLMIDLAPIRRDILKQIVPDGHLENLTPEERQRIGRELNQRMLGIAQGLQLGAAGLQKRAADAEREAQTSSDKAAQMSADVASKSAATKARAAEATKAADGAKPATTVKTAPAPTPTATPAPAGTQAPIKKKTEMTGSHIGVVVEQNGQVVEQISAEVNLPQLLATVFSTTRRDRGEVPFAIAKDGKIYTPTDDDRKTIEGLKLPTPPDKQTSTTFTKGDWIVVETADPSGSGLRLGIAKPVADLVGELRKTAARNASLGLGFIGLALVAIVPLSGRLTRNLSKLTEGVDRISHGDYSARVPLKTNDEIGRLATAFNQMATDVEQHQRAAVEQERVKRELELGRRIQHEMLPHEPLRLGLTEIKGVSVPALEVGGDFFNYFELDDHRIALLVGDVSGKGVGAALLMANIQASLRTRLALGQELAAIAEATDRDVDENSPGPVYATLFVGILDPATRRLQYVNAGHHPQYAICKSGLERMASTGLPVGLLSGRGYTAREVQLSAGDLLFFYTDGCVEASNLAGEMFGAERLEALLTTGGPMSPEDVLLRVEQAVKAFRGAAEPFDDETMMAVRVG
ncbi:MAG TPA: SpoIIE family protein phosphatase, partial [Vicinamibacterales bacterium]|nr:SpoIIE family protein phosphatase [Vicinamibacterales bacterium]